MNRREFITTMFGAAASVAILAKLDGIPLDVPMSEPIGSAEIGRTIAEEAWRLFQTIAAEKGHLFTVKDDREYAYGQMVDGMAFRHLFGIDTLTAPDEFGRRSAFYLRPVMKMLVSTAQHRGVGVYARLPLPRSVETAEQAGAIRYVRCWDAVRCEFITRFDILGACTAENLRTSYRVRGEQTKA